MAEQLAEPNVSETTAPHGPEDEGGWRLPRLVVWGVISFGFLVLLGAGSLQARIWRLGYLYFEDRRIFEVWAYQGRNLPEVGAHGLLVVLYFAAIAVLIVGTMLGLLYLLDEAGTGARHDASTHTPSHGTDAHGHA